MTPTRNSHFWAKTFSAAAVLATVLLSACGSSSTTAGTSTGSATATPSTLTACTVTAQQLTITAASTTPTAPTATAGLTGTKIAIDGSSALEPLFKQAHVPFDQVNGTVTTTNPNGSGNGLKDVESGAVNIGLSDFFYQQNSATQGFTDLVDHQMAVVAFTLVVSSDIHSTVENLTSDQIKGIYTGTYTNWSQLGGPNETITVINRPLASGTRATFKQYVLGGVTESAGQTLTQDTTGAVATALSTSQGAIGYVATGFVLQPQFATTIFPICIDGYGATAANINSGNYKFWSYEHAYTKGAAQPAEQALINYVLSDTVQSSLVPSLGYLKVSDLTAAAQATHPTP